MLRKYKMGFDIWALVLFVVIMIPNFVWFAIPAPNDILRVESVTKMLDMIASISQVAMLIVLCTFINTECAKRSMTRFNVAVIVNCMLYFVCWIFYYSGVFGVVVILGMMILPCLAFLFFAIDRKNNIAIIPISIFTICHMIYGVVNYII